MNNESLTSTGAVGAVLAPYWLPSLTEISQVSALLLPVLGALWLVLQITLKIIGVLITERQRQRAADDRFLGTVQAAIDPAQEPHITVVAGENKLTYDPREKKADE